MSKSAHLRIQDVRAILQVVGECRDAGDGSAAWKQHLLRTASRLVSADLLTATEMAARGSPPAILDLTSWGWENGFDQDTWLQGLAAFQSTPSFSNGWNRYSERLRQDDGVALARPDFVSDKEYEASTEYQGVFRPLGLGNGMMCFRSLPMAGGVIFGISLWRAAGAQDFGGRDRVLLRELQAGIAPLIGGPLARPGEPSPADLSPRVRQVLRCLLEGDGDKQIASRLGLTRHTVNEYTKALFRHFGVQSRAELLARWVRRGFPTRFSWEEE
jgi:DNA-binding CsgD family transcriptional regulator